MLNILPVPRFADKWYISCKNMSDIWSILLNNVAVWTLAQEKRLRGYNISLTLENISAARMEKYLQESQQDLQYIRKSQYYIKLNKNTLSKANMNHLGHIYFCADNIEKYTQHQHLELYQHLISVGIDSILELQNKTNFSLKRKIMTKFGISSIN